MKRFRLPLLTNVSSGFVEHRGWLKCGWVNIPCLPCKTSLIGLLIFTVFILMSCASGPKMLTARQLSYQPFDFPDETRVLGLCTLLTLEEIKHGGDAGFKVKIPPLYNELIEIGYDEERIQDGSISLVLNSMYWNNASAPMRADKGMRWAIVPIDLIPKISTEYLGVVEVQLQDGIGKVIKIRHVNFSDSDCQFLKDKRSLGMSILESFSYFGVGPSGSQSLYCNGLEEEGWVKIKYGWKDEYIWVKFPEGYVPPE